ncbi:MAG TPA: SMI1/KNR4 family protein [Ktedonosporobacter sp.]|nr:SMI1/KNR4 family protein [Ktedonosporobacter sp.]
MDEKIIPPQFDESFLRWFQVRTEEAWQNYPMRTFEEYVAGGIGGRDWQHGTRWLNGLSEQEIASIEQHYQMRFPPDYRLFLQLLHSVDRPLMGARYTDSTTMIPVTAPSFYNWQTERSAIEQAYEEVIEGILFDVQHNDNIWPAKRGKKPATEEAQEARIRELVAAAPRLIPIIGHRFLLAEPHQNENPVFSIHQTDMIIYAPNLYLFFLQEFAYLLNLPQETRTAIVGQKNAITNKRYAHYEKIPFWGQFL